MTTLYLLSNLIADSCPLSPAAGTQERESKQEDRTPAKLRLIEDVNILRDNTAGKTLAVSARVENICSEINA